MGKLERLEIHGQSNLKLDIVSNWYVLNSYL